MEKVTIRVKRPLKENRKQLEWEGLSEYIF